MMGSNKFGQLGVSLDLKFSRAPCLVDSLKKINLRRVECGSNFTFALGSERKSVQGVKEEGDQLYSWGCNENGQLAIGTGVDIKTGGPFKLDKLIKDAVNEQGLCIPNPTRVTQIGKETK